MQRIAEDPRYFTYLTNCRDKSGVAYRVKLGDARLTLAGEPDNQFDLLMIDAFSSDAIPIHLITREAVEMYFQKLAPGGLLVVHVSNRHLRLEPVLAARPRSWAVWPGSARMTMKMAASASGRQRGPSWHTHLRTSAGS